MSEEKSYDLKKSVEGLGQLYPILIDAHGNVIDGFHRKDIDPKWPTLTLDHIDSTVKLEAARLAANFNRRNVSPEELRQKIGFLVGAGLKPAEIAKLTGLSERTIYRYTPEALKDKAKVDAGRVKSEVSRDVVTAVSRLVECECCGMGTREPKAFGKYTRLCDRCYFKAVKYPRLFAREPTAKPEVKEFKPKETGEFRRAQMQPPRSKFEDQFDEAAAKAGLPYGESNIDICVQKFNVDKYYKCPKGNLIVEFKGPVHKGREDRDEARRDLLLRKPNTEMLEIDYEAPSQQAVQDAVVAVRGKLVELGGIKV